MPARHLIAVVRDRFFDALGVVLGAATTCIVRATLQRPDSLAKLGVGHPMMRNGVSHITQCPPGTEPPQPGLHIESVRAAQTWTDSAVSSAEGTKLDRLRAANSRK